MQRSQKPVTISSPEIPQDPLDQPPEPRSPTGELAQLEQALLLPEPTRHPEATRYERRNAWYAAVLVVVVLGSACALLLTGEPLHEALLLGGGVTLLGAEITRRILADAGPVPSIVVTCAVTALAVVLIARGYQASDVAVIAGMAGLVAGEVAARILRSTTPRRGV
jgi:hypothetical protein